MKTKSILFRLDADNRIGLGHLMRCLAIAQELGAAAWNPCFLIHNPDEKVQGILKNEQFSFVQLDVAPASLADAESVIAEAQKHQAEWVAIDGYHYTEAYLRRIKDSGLKLFLLDDFGESIPVRADLILNTGCPDGEALYPGADPKSIMAGPRYVPLRRNFLRWKESPPEINPVCKRILITLGGSVHTESLRKVLEILRNVCHPETEIRITGELPAGISADNLPRLTSLPHAEEIDQFMRWADIVICASGSTVWELAFLGIPFLYGILAQNQLRVADTLSRAGAGIPLGSFEAPEFGRLLEDGYQRLADDLQLRKALSGKGRLLVDGEGVKRIRMRLEGSPVRLRTAAASDCELLFEWANDPEVRRFSFQDQTIQREEHTNWFYSRLRAPGSMLFIALDERDVPVGQIRFDLMEQTAKVSIMLAAEARGKGLGIRILKEGAACLARQRPEIQQIDAFIKRGNAASESIFKKAGYRHAGSEEIRGARAEHYVYQIR